MDELALAHVEWRKSVISGGNHDCVEVARLAGAVGIRDSKAPEAGHLSLSVEGFAALLARVRRDEFRRSA